MKRLQCGKEIPEGRKFCSSSCSAKFNNTRRVRKPWTEEQRNAITKKHYCKYCGKEIFAENRERFVCKECQPYVRVNLYKKLQLNEGSLKQRYFETLDIFKELYYREKLPFEGIQERTGINSIIVRNIFQKEQLPLRTMSEALEASFLVGRKSSPESQNQYCTCEHVSWEGKKFWCRSSWEDRYASELDSKKIPYEIEGLRISYYDTELQRDRVAIPDFYLPETKEIVEIKSSWTIVGQEQRMKDKFRAYRQVGYSPKLILDWKYQENF